MEAVSVVIPSFNRAALVGRAIRSVLPQLAPGDEIIVVDDESTDDTAAVVTPFGPPVRYVRNVHRGLACGSARNRGIDEAVHPLIAFLDSDDEWLPGKLALQRAFMSARPEVVFCFSDFECRCDDGRVWHNGLLYWHEDHRPWDEILGPGRPYSAMLDLPPGAVDVRVHVGDMYSTLLRNNYIATQSTLVRRRLAGAAFRFAEDVPIHEEYECYARIAKRGPAAYFDCETFVQWGHAGPRMSIDADEWKRSQSRLLILPRIWGSDAEFLRSHATAYAENLRGEHLASARLSIRAGRMREARTHLRDAGGGPLRYRLASFLPGGLLRGAVRLKQALRSAEARRHGTEDANDFRRAST